MDATFNQEFKVILGSSSVARRKILTDMGFEFTTMSADIDEKAIRKEKPEDLVMALAEAKADAIVEKLHNIENQEKDAKPTLVIAADTVENAQPKLHGKEDAEPTLLITCDQVVVYEGMIREKPSSKEEARQFLKDYSGGHASTVSSVLVTNLSTGLRKGDWDKVEADAIVEKLHNIENQEKDAKPTLVIAADTVENAQPKLHGKEDAEPTLLITCDQVVVYEGMIREKPSSKEEARQFLKDYSGGHASTVSSVLVTNLSTGLRKGDWDKVEIHFDDIPEQVIDNLIEEGIVLNVAGGLIIEHHLIFPYVKEVMGGTDSVMGLPKALTRRLMKEVL